MILRLKNATRRLLFDFKIRKIKSFEKRAFQYTVAMETSSREGSDILHQMVAK